MGIGELHPHFVVMQPEHMLQNFSKPINSGPLWCSKESLYLRAYS